MAPGKKPSGKRSYQLQQRNIKICSCGKNSLSITSGGPVKLFEGDITQLIERWQSVQRHVVNIHTWICATKFTRCEHGEQEPKTWIESGSEAHKALQATVMEKKFLKDLKQVTAFCHSGNLEGFHNMLLKYMPKRTLFSQEGTIARGLLAFIDNNMNAEREYVTQEGGGVKHALKWSKRSKSYVVYKVKTAKAYGFRDALIEGVFHRAIEGQRSHAQLVDKTQKKKKKGRH